MEHKVVSDYSRDSLSDNTHVKVCVRVRPCADGKTGPEALLSRSEDSSGKLTIKAPTSSQFGEHTFSFDNIYWTDTKQSDIFEHCIKPTVDSALKGINSCCLAYGQTGSGKSYSIFGESGESRGILPRSVEYLFSSIGRNSSALETKLVVSFLEIYCGQIRDLGLPYVDKMGGHDNLGRQNTTEWYMKNIEQISGFARDSEFRTQDNLQNEIHEDSDGNIFVRNLSLIPVRSARQVDEIIQMGLRLRATSETKMNAYSSRSHTVFSTTVLQRDINSGESTIARMNMVDLAGSERIKKSESDGQRLKEALHINSSLSAIGKVVMSLDPDSGAAYIPYRDSKLTRLLQNSIGGNSFTTLLATIHPMTQHYDECISTLQFANRCRTVQNQPRVNYVGQTSADKDRRIRRLQEEVNGLRRQLDVLRCEHKFKMSTVLQELGIDVSDITDDGVVTLADGTVIAADPFEDESSERASVGNLTARSTQSTSSKSSTIESKLKTEHSRPTPDKHTVSSPKAKQVRPGVIHAISRGDQNHLRKKITELKEDIAKAEVNAKLSRDKQNVIISQQKQEINVLTQAYKEKVGAINSMTAAQNAKHAEDVKRIVEHNQIILNEQHKLLNNIPQNLRVNSESLSRAKDAENTIRSQAEKKLVAAVQTIQLSKEKEINIIKQQYEYWLMQKEAQAELFIEDFNKFRASKNHTENIMKQEFIDLYEYTTQLQQIIQKEDSRRYPLPNNVLANPDKLNFFNTWVAAENTSKNQVNVSQRNSTIKHSKQRPGSAPAHRTANKSSFAQQKQAAIFAARGQEQRVPSDSVDTSFKDRQGVNRSKFALSPRPKAPRCSSAKSRRVEL